MHKAVASILVATVLVGMSSEALATIRSVPASGQQTLLRATLPDHEYERWFHMDITVISNTVSLYVDGVRLVDGDLPLYSMDSLGFSVWRANAEFDNLVVRTGLAVQPLLTMELSHVRLCWNSDLDQTYQLQYTSALTSNTWINVGAPIPGNGDINCVTHELTDPPRTYRLELAE